VGVMLAGMIDHALSLGRGVEGGSN
jgi:hypothetical protein